MRMTILIGWFLFATPVLSEDGYFCATDLATGFEFDKARKSWRTINFHTDNLQWKIIRRDSTVSKNVIVKPDDTWVVVNPDNTHLISMGCQESAGGTNLLCEGVGRRLNLNKQNFRLLVVFDFGYWTDIIGGDNDLWAEGKQNPVIGIGRCRTL